MLKAEQRLLGRACIFAMLVTICFAGPALSVRRHSTRNEQSSVSMATAGCGSAQTRIANQVAGFPSLTTRPDKHPTFHLPGVTKHLADIPADNTLQLTNVVAELPAKTITPFLHLAVPGYYAFLFRYVLF